MFFYIDKKGAFFNFSCRSNLINVSLFLFNRGLYFKPSNTVSLLTHSVAQIIQNTMPVTLGEFTSLLKWIIIHYEIMRIYYLISHPARVATVIYLMSNIGTVLKYFTHAATPPTSGLNLKPQYLPLEMALSCAVAFISSSSDAMPHTQAVDSLIQ